MLVLGVQVGERIFIGDNIVIEVLERKDKKKMRLGFTAPSDIKIMREDLLKRIQAYDVELRRDATKEG